MASDSLDFTWKDLQVGLGNPQIVSTYSMMPHISYIYTACERTLFKSEEMGVLYTIITVNIF